MPPANFQVDFRGLDIIRGRDCVVFAKGEGHPVVVSAQMLQGGWSGGQGVQWEDSDLDDMVVTYSNGLFGGFMLWGSDEAADRYTAMTGNQLVYGFGIMMVGHALISTSTYERYTYASRIGGGPLVPLVYQPRDTLYFSLRGLWTKEDEMTLSGNPLAPALFTGFVAQTPKANNEFFLGIQTAI